MMKVVLKLELNDEKIKQKAMKTVSGLSGLDSISIDMKDKKLTVTGDIDPVTVVAKLRKFCHTEIVTVGPAKEPEKKKEEPKKEDPKKKDPKDDLQAQLMKAYQAYYQHPNMVAYNHHPQTQPYHYRIAEEDPNSCVIC